MKKFLIACGGTGGHLAPGIALAEGLQARGHVVTLLISHKKVDARLVEKYPQLEFLRVPSAPFTLNPVGFVRCLVRQTQGLWFCRKLVRKTAPSAVIGFGGFTTAAVVAAAVLSGVPAVLHEANRVPGRAIRTLGRWAKRVYLPQGVALASLKRGVAFPMGLPVRREIVALDRDEACQRLGLDPSRATLVILGGSQGATALNDWVQATTPEFIRSGVQVFCVTGLGKGKNEGRAPVTGAPVYTPFCDDMAAAMSAADLVITRAGAGTLAELARCRAPAILIPYPHAADNHQQANAEAFVQRGGGELVEQGKLDTLWPVAKAWLDDSAKLDAAREQLAELDQENSLARLINDLEQLTGGYSESGPEAYRV